MILISGVGLILLSLTNRFGHVADRSRQLGQELQAASAAERALLLAQVQVLARRARLLRLAIALACLSALSASVLVIALFCFVLAGADATVPVGLLFIAAMISLIGALLAFLQDINLSLHALKLELGEAFKPRG
ncbi:MAG: DUF2721 domain-containing protein [Verrucomicrobia bacterium]|nr:DUF2721 domain-containing protein [Verrucomicrobiota bacterium]